MTMAGKKAWRDAATVILTAKNGHHLTTNTFDYSVLMLKRSSKSKFMPNAYVFPGGVLSPSDTSSGWLDLFRDLGHTRDDLEELVLKGVDRPLLMKAEADEALARDIALRFYYEELKHSLRYVFSKHCYCLF